MQSTTPASGRRIRKRLSLLAALTLLLGLASALVSQVPAHASVAVGDFVYTARTSSDTLVKLHTSSGTTTLADAGGNIWSGGNGMASPAIDRPDRDLLGIGGVQAEASAQCQPVPDCAVTGQGLPGTLFPR